MQNGTGLSLPFVFIPDGAEAPAAWRAAHPDAVRLPARLVMRGGVRRVQFAVPMPAPPPPLWSPAKPRDPVRDLERWIIERWPNIFRSEPDTDRKVRPPPGSKPIDETRWSGDHRAIKKSLGARPRDNIKISPDGDVWGENPDGSWTHHGPADLFIGSDKPQGRKVRDRDGR